MNQWFPGCWIELSFDLNQQGYFWIEWYFELNLGQSNIESNIEWINFWQNSNIELNQIGYRQPLITIQSNDLIDRILPKVSRWRSQPCPALHKLAKWEVGSREARSLARNPWTRSHSPFFRSVELRHVWFFWWPHAVKSYPLYSYSEPQLSGLVTFAGRFARTSR